MESITETVSTLSNLLIEFEGIASGASATDYNGFNALVSRGSNYGVKLGTLGISDTLGWQSLASQNASVIRKKMREYHYVLSLVPEILKRDDPMTIYDLQNAINLQANDLANGAPGVAEEIKQKNSALLAYDGERDDAAIMRWEGRSLIRDLLSGSRRAKANIDPDGEVYGDYDASHRTRLESLMHVRVGGSLASKTDRLISVGASAAASTGTFVSQTLTRGLWAAGANASGAVVGFISVATAGVLVVDVIADDGAVVTTSAVPPLLLAESTLTTAAQAALVSFTATIAGQAFVSTQDIVTDTRTVRRHTITVTEQDTAVSINASIAAIGSSTCCSGEWHVVDFFPNGRPSQGFSALGVAQGLEVNVGDLSQFELDAYDLIETNSYLRVIGLYDEWLSRSGSTLNRDRDMRNVLSEAAEEMTYGADLFADLPVFSAEFWLTGRATVGIDRQDWRKLFRKFHRLLALYEAAMLCSDQFMTNFARRRVGLSN